MQIRELHKSARCLMASQKRKYKNYKQLKSVT